MKENSRLLVVDKHVFGKELLVDLVGIEPTTSSMPWYRKNVKLLLFNGL
jgi:hypothetical protein